MASKEDYLEVTSENFTKLIDVDLIPIKGSDGSIDALTINIMTTDKSKHGKGTFFASNVYMSDIPSKIPHGAYTTKEESDSFMIPNKTKHISRKLTKSGDALAIKVTISDMFPISVILKRYQTGTIFMSYGIGRYDCDGVFVRLIDKIYYIDNGVISKPSVIYYHNLPMIVMTEEKPIDESKEDKDY